MLHVQKNILELFLGIQNFDAGSVWIVTDAEWTWNCFSVFPGHFQKENRVILNINTHF